jgi:hypothetical protein
MEYRHTSSPRPKKFKTMPSTGIVLNRGSTSQILLLHDNAIPHTAHATIDALETLKFEALSHPPYSPYLAPSDFHFFPHLKRISRGLISPQMMK